jgi:hypothetical protein
LEEITKPVIIKELPDPIERCLDNKNKIAQKYKFTTNEAGEFEKFLAGYALNLIEKNNVMLVCHKLDILGEIVRRNKIEFKKIGTSLWNFNTIIMKLDVYFNQFLMTSGCLLY